MITHVQQVKDALKMAKSYPASAVEDGLFEKAYHAIESLEEAVAELEQELDDVHQDFDALNREFDEYVSDHAD